ncbi:hypothetical protein CYK37_22230 [Mesorhizobium loti]|nr:hypothetical protein [Mesorhizobium loti]PLP56968.1 hypothetical protein CYK37_22230 [Mesorhizobium loti]
MRQASLSDLLPDFGAPSLHGGAPAHALAESPTFADGPPAIDIDKLIAMAVAKAEDALETKLTAAFADQIEAERRTMAEEARALTEGLGGEIGQAVDQRMQQMEQHLHDLMGDAVARIIGGLLSDDLQKRSLLALEKVIRDTLADNEAARISIRGPLSLYEPLKATLGKRAASLDFAEATTVDLTLVVNETVVETRISEWSAALSEVLS